MTLRRRVLVAVSGVLGMAGCLGDNETTTTPNSSPTQETNEPKTENTNVPDEHPEWLNEDGVIKPEILKSAHFDAVWADDGVWNRLHSKLDTAEPTGHPSLRDHDLVMEREGTERLRYDHRLDDSYKGAGVKFPFGYAYYFEAKDVVDYFDTGSFYSKLWAVETVFEQELKAEKLQYQETIEYEDEPAYRLAAGDIEAIVDLDDVVRRISGEMTVELEDKDSDMTFERTVSRDVDPELPEWVHRVPWLTGELVASDTFEISHKGGASLEASTEIRLRYNIEGDGTKETHLELQQLFEQDDVLYVVLVEKNGDVLPEIRRKKPTEDFKDIDRLIVDRETDNYSFSVST